MTDEEIVKRAKDAEKRTGFGELVHSPISKGINSAYGIGFIEGMVEYRNSLQEEPVSEELDEVAKQYAKDYLFTAAPTRSLTDHFKAGAKWQKEQIMKDAINTVVHIDAGNYPYIPQIELYDYDNDIPLAKGGEKVKVIVIKED